MTPPDIERIVAPNPGPMTLEGTNTYVVGRDPAWVVDPGPRDESHAARVRAVAEARGGIGGVVLTHSHADHSGAVALLGSAPAWGSESEEDETEPGASGAGDAATPAPAPARVGPFEVLPTPGHARDHVCFIVEDVCFCGDLLLGRGSTFVPPDGGSLAAYLRSLALLRERRPGLLLPGHGPAIEDPVARIDEYVEHRLMREGRLLRELEAGERSRAALLAAAWADVAEPLRPAAAVVMQAHLEKLDAEARLPGGMSGLRA